MGAAVIAVVFVAGLFGAPSIFGHGSAHAGQQPTTTQTATQASAQAPTPVQPTQAAAATEVASDDIVQP